MPGHYDDDGDFDRPRTVRRRRRRRRGTGLAAPGPVVFALGISGFLILTSFAIRGTAIGVAYICVGVMILAQFWFLAIALSDSIGQLLLCLFLPFYSLFYLIKNFAETKWPLGLDMLALFTLFASMVFGAIREGISGDDPPVAAVGERDESDPDPPRFSLRPPPTPVPAPPAPRKDEPPPGFTRLPPASATPATPSKVDPRRNNVPAAQPFAVDPQAKAAGKTLYLAALTPFAYQAGPWKLGIGGQGEPAWADPVPTKVQGREYKYGISMHPPQAANGACRVSFVPGREFQRFKGWAAMNDGPDPRGTVLFAAYGDGRKLWDSPAFTKAGTAAEFNIAVAGVEVLTLETRMWGGDYYGANAVWLDSWLER